MSQFCVSNFQVHGFHFTAGIVRSNINYLYLLKISLRCCDMGAYMHVHGYASQMKCVALLLLLLFWEAGIRSRKSLQNTKEKFRNVTG